MRTNKKQAIINVILAVIQVFIFAPSILLEYLSEEKMGVMRYLVFKKRIYEETFFDSYFMNLYKLVLIIGIVICVILFIYNYVKIIDKSLTKSIIVAIVANLTGIVFIVDKHMQLLNAYYFFLISIFITIVLQYIKLLTKYLLKK